MFAPTGSGKTAVTQVAAAVLGGISLFLQPTQALQGDQCLRQMKRDNTWVYNLDVVCNDLEASLNVLAQLKTVLELPAQQRPCVCVYISPRKFKKNNILR